MNKVMFLADVRFPNTLYHHTEVLLSRFTLEERHYIEFDNRVHSAHFSLKKFEVLLKQNSWMGSHIS
jgi:hypothetical protein